MLEPGQRHQAVSALQQRFGEMSRERARRIALIGLRGAGKSTLGVRLAARLEAPFFELDQQIERELGAGLESIFSMYGQDTYREAERRVLDRLTRTHRRCVIATGGSLVLEPRTYELLRERCLTIWLKASPEEHMEPRDRAGRPAADPRARSRNGRVAHHPQAARPALCAGDAAVDTTGASESASLKRLVDVIAVASPLAGSSAREAPVAPA